jgi:hypothetical protein
MERTADTMTRRYIEQFARTCKAESRADEAEQWQTQVPWSALRMVLDAAYQFAEGNAELWADCEQVQTWVDEYEIGDESCATIHPETWGTDADSALLTGTGKTNSGGAQKQAKSATCP